MKIRYSLEFNRAKKLNKLGQGLIHIRAYQDGHKAYFSSSIFVMENQFDGMVVNHPHAMELNGMLMEMIMKLEGVELNLWKQGVSPTLDHLRMAWREKAEATDFAWYARDIIEKSNRKRLTKVNLLQTVKKIEEFGKVNLTDVSYRYLKDFENWLRGKGIQENTINKEMRNVRTLYGEALREGLVQNNPFIRYKLPKTTRNEHVTLTEEELKRIEKVEVHTATRDAFLFCCSTGMRFSDYANLTESNFEMVKGKCWLVYKTVKTGCVVRFPIYIIGVLPHPKIKKNSVANEQLKEICGAAKIKKRVTFHTSRHTFATLMLSRGIPITTVQRLLGHTSVRMTERYAETTERKMEMDVLRVFGKKGRES